MGLGQDSDGAEAVTTSRLRTQTAPGRIEILPALPAAPACRGPGNVEQSVATRANQFSAVPAENSLRRDADFNGVGKQMEADRAALSLIRQCPAESQDPTKEKYRRGGREYRDNDADREEHGRHEEGNFEREKHPSAQPD